MLNKAEPSQKNHAQCIHNNRRRLWLAFLIIVVCACATSVSAQWTTNGTNISNTNSGNVGVGTASPGSRLTVVGPVQNGVYTVQIDSTAGGQAGAQNGILIVGTSATTYLTAGRRQLPVLHLT